MALLAFLALMGCAAYTAKDLASEELAKQRIEREQRLNQKSDEQKAKDEAFQKALNEHLQSCYADENGEYHGINAIFASLDAVSQAWNYAKDNVKEDE